jgi:hypothetical protein
LLQEQSVEAGATSVSDMVVLLGSGVTIKDTAEALFKGIAQTNTLFIRGRAGAGIVQHSGTSAIEVIFPRHSAFTL